MIGRCRLNSDTAPRAVIFCHSLVSDWNHGNAHFLRGLAAELQSRGWRTDVYEPCNGWSRRNLIAEHGERPLEEFRRRVPHLESRQYDLDSLDFEQALAGARLVLAHEWNEPALIARLGEWRVRGGDGLLFFHDTHHRSATAPGEMARFDLSGYDGVLAFGRVICDLYLQRGWARRAWVWHEAADGRMFRPHPGQSQEGDLVWVGNWGDDERTAELEEFLLRPARDLRLRAAVYGVRYPPEAQRMLAKAGVEYRGWLPNYLAPEVFGRFRFTVHVPRRPYVESLPGVPTIRVFEALASGIPLICSPWRDSEGLFAPGEDFWMAGTGDEMKARMARLLEDEELARRLASRGRRTILRRHTCSQRVDELFEIAASLDPRFPSPLASAAAKQEVEARG